MRYTIIWDKAAEKFISRLAKPQKERVLKAIYNLSFEGDIKAYRAGIMRGCSASTQVITA